MFNKYIILLKKHIRHPKNHLKRLSKKTVQFSIILIGAAFVAGVSMIFAHLADWAIHLNAHWVREMPWLPWIILPLGLPLLRFLVTRFAPYSVGSGIPQIIASLSLKDSSYGRNKLTSLFQALLKIPFTFLALLIGASVGREGPSVQVGAAVMYAWGKLCKKWNLTIQGFKAQEWLAAGAASGLAAAFNAPLAGVIFAIEELGKGLNILWHRVVLLGVLASGFFVVALMGNNPYFGKFNGEALDEYMWLWVLVCAVVCGITGGLFARLLSKGYAFFAPARARNFLRNHPYIVAFFLGLIVASIGYLTNFSSFGTSYDVADHALRFQEQYINHEIFGISKLIATVASYWSGISGGIFTPALTTGAGIGLHLSGLFNMWPHQDILVLLCMAAFLSAATQAPITSAVIVMEMVGSQPMFFWLMLVAIFASMVSKQICPHPFYHFVALRFRQRAIEENKQYEQRLETAKNQEKIQQQAFQDEVQEALNAVKK
ncbi:chloride channel protein [Basilea psittacipulmonis]|uniref:chloride channel protein n=1 Tax=Basilea psittacipulmonis TaxID=1472345 RepID=UPI00069224A4|nr:chloride channel protein [Basilea psittacipulmonis]